MNDLHTAIEATSSTLEPLLKQYVAFRTIYMHTICRHKEKYSLIVRLRNGDGNLEMADGISLLLLRPQLLMSSLHQLIVLTAMRLSGVDVDTVEPTYPSLDVDGAEKDRQEIADNDEAVKELCGELALDNEIFDKIRGLESKLEYQIKKLVGLADASANAAANAQAAVEEGMFSLLGICHTSTLSSRLVHSQADPLSFRPNPSAIVSTRPTETRKTEDGTADVYRPPRLAAVHYEPDKEKRKRERRAPALLSEFATTMDGAPVIESTSGLSTRPVARHTNSTSAKRAAELQRMDQFEEDNMTRLVTTKREAKRRREDEEALALGYGVGGPARSRGRRQNGLEAELEGVLGDRGSKGVWDGVRGAKRTGLLDRGKSASSAATPKPKKAKFERDVSRRK